MAQCPQRNVDYLMRGPDAAADEERGDFNNLRLAEVLWNCESDIALVEASADVLRENRRDCYARILNDSLCYLGFLLKLNTAVISQSELERFMSYLVELGFSGRTLDGHTFSEDRFSRVAYA